MAKYNHTRSITDDTSPTGFCGVSASWTELQSVDVDRVWGSLDSCWGESSYLYEGNIVAICKHGPLVSDEVYINPRFSTEELFIVGSDTSLSHESGDTTVLYGSSGSRVRLTRTEEQNPQYQLISGGEVIETATKNTYLIIPKDEFLVEEFGIESQYLASII